MKKWFYPLALASGLVCVGYASFLEAAPEVPDTAFTSPPMLHSKGEKTTFISLARFEGINENKEINVSNASIGAAYYVTDGLGLYGQLFATLVRGDRDNNSADAEGVGAFFALRWHFLRSKNWSLYMNHGIGPVLFLDDFPPGGTKLNALIQYGLGFSVRTGKSKLMQVGVRHSHISNGKGLVAENPSYDGHGLYVEVAHRF